MENKMMHKCQSCGSTSLVFGYLGGTASVFVPSGIFTMYGFKTRTFLCLKCGQVSQYLPQSKLIKLREKFKELTFDSE